MPDPDWIAEIAALEKAATKGPWRFTRALGKNGCFLKVADLPEHPLSHPPNIIWGVPGDRWDALTRDGDFIAGSRTTAPDLIRTCRALAAALESLRHCVASEWVPHSHRKSRLRRGSLLVADRTLAAYQSGEFGEQPD